jgi:hypothetical protein
VITSSWKAPDEAIETFLTAYERRGADPQSDSGGDFADQFLVIDPNRALVLAREVLVASLPTRRKMFESAGVGALHRTAARQLDLDERHLLVAVDWEADRTGGEPVHLQSTFLLRREADGPRILVYLNHGDVAAVLSQTEP